MMLIIHLLEFLFLFVIHTGLTLTESEKQMSWFESLKYCKLGTEKNVHELNTTRNVWLGGLFLQTPWMVHRGCFKLEKNSSWTATARYNIKRTITSSCSYKCRNDNYFALRGPWCACLSSLFNMVEMATGDCTLTCYGSNKDLCGAAKYFTVYKQEVENGTTSNRQPVTKWITNETFAEILVKNGTISNRQFVTKWVTNETFAEIRNQIADVYNVKCLLLNESLQYVPMSCNLNYSALCESGSERALPGSRQPVFGMTTNVAELTTETLDTTKATSMSTTPVKKTVISTISTTVSPETREAFFKTTTYVTEQRTKNANINHSITSPSSNKMSAFSEAYITTTSTVTKSLMHVKITTITVITVVGALIAIVVILLLYRRKRKRIIYHSRNSASNDIHASLEGEQTMQIFSSNNRSRNRTNTVPFILQQKQRPGNISVSNYQDPVDMENQYQRLDFSMRSDLKEVHDDYAMQLYNRTSSAAVNDDGSKSLKKARLTKGTKDLKEVYNNYSLPYDAFSRPTPVNKDDMKIQIKVLPSVTMKDKKHTNVAYCDTAIVHEQFLYDIPKHSSKSLDNRCSIKK